MFQSPVQSQSNFIISPSNHRVVYIHSSLFKNMPNTIGTVGLIHGDNCGSYLSNLCQQDPCNTTLALFLNVGPKVMITPRDIEDKLHKNILGFLTVELYNDYAEIYNVCTSKRARGKGVMKSVFKSFLNDVPKDHIWLGIDMRNPMRDAVLHLYLSVGFDVMGIQRITPTGSFPSFPFISMVYHKANPIIRDKEKVFVLETDTKRVISQFEKSDGACKIFTYIQPELIQNIRDRYIHKNVEHGGIMGIKKVGDRKYKLGLAAVTKGSRDRFQVVIPTHYINWHTHPFVCYTKNLCYIGWPSGADMGLLVRNYTNGLLAHVLFANEGVYFLQLSPDMMVFLQAMTIDCIDAFTTLIKYFFADLENYRNIKYDPERLRCMDKINDVSCLTYDNEQKNISIKRILYIINNTLLSDLLRLKPNNPNVQKLVEASGICVTLAMNRLKKNPNVPVFRVQYTPMEIAAKNGITTQIQYYMSPSKSTCSPPDYSGKVEFGLAPKEMNISSGDLSIFESTKSSPWGPGDWENPI